MSAAIEHYLPGKSHLQLCVDEHKYTSTYLKFGGDSGVKGEIEIERVQLDGGGYERNGAYFGIGAPLFRVWFVTEATGYKAVHEFRGSNENGAASRKALRNELKKLYPSFKVNR